MKIINSPPDLSVTTVNKNVESVSFKKFLVDALDAHAALGKSVKLLRQLSKIVDIIEQSNGTITLEDADYDVIKAAMHYDGDQGRWYPGTGRQLLPFFDAVERVQDVEK